MGRFLHYLNVFMRSLITTFILIDRRSWLTQGRDRGSLLVLETNGDQTGVGLHCLTTSCKRKSSISKQRVYITVGKTRHILEIMYDNNNNNNNNNNACNNNNNNENNNNNIY